MHSEILARRSIARRGWIYALYGGLALPVLVGAQSARDSSLYLQAQQMVANGDVADGRKLADSVAAAAPVGSAGYAEGLFWRATLSENARDSEHEYRQIIVDYPLSGRVPDALLRIGQLESARGDNAAALQHFQRLVLEHPQSPLHAEASYSVAQMYFGANDPPRACLASADALASVRGSNVELKNRIDFQQQRCRGVTLATNAKPATASVATPIAVPVDKAAATKSSKPAPKTRTKAATKVVARVATKTPVADHSDTNVTAPIETTTATKTGVVSRAPTKEEVARALASAETPRLSKKPKAAASKAKSISAATSSAPARDTATPAVASDEPASKSESFAIQVAAFSTKTPATLLVAKLRGRGYNAYVDGASAPYRVRVGRYPTHAAAAAELVKLKAKQIDGFVAER